MQAWRAGCNWQIGVNAAMGLQKIRIKDESGIKLWRRKYHAVLQNTERVTSSTLGRGALGGRGGMPCNTSFESINGVGSGPPSLYKIG